MDNKTAIVTGAAAGIGKAVALAFAREGARVACADIDREALQATVDEMEAIGASALALQVDVSDATAVRRMVSETVNAFGRLDYACNNAGIEGAQEKTADYSAEEWDRVMNVNLRGQWLCMKEEIPAMLRTGGGSIVNVSSILGMVGFAGAPAYTAAKHGLIGLTRAAALEYAGEGIRVNAVCPAFIDTPMLERSGITTDEENREMIAGLHALNRLGGADEVAEAVVWLASDKASFVTGHPMMVDGGYTTR